MDIQQYIASGILEDYLLGLLDEAESREVERMIATTPEVRAAFADLEAGLESLALAAKTKAPSGLKTSVMDAIDSLIQEEAGFDPKAPPVISDNSTAEDFAFWVNMDGATAPDEIDNIHFVPIGKTDIGTSAIVWMTDGAPEEVHTDVIEKFLVLEGTCDIRIGDTVYHLVPGDVLSIPLHVPHDVNVTSDIPCKFILQRIAA